MKQDKTKYLVISVGDMHEGLIETLKENAQKNKLTVSHYVRHLLYKALSSESKSTATGLDDARAEGSVGDGVRQSA